MITININPVAFTIGPVEVRWYGITIALAVVVLVLWMLRKIKKGARLTPDTVLSAALVGIPSGMIFSRLLHVIDAWGYYSQHLNEIVGGGGLTAYGAVLGATLGIWVYSRFSKLDFGYFADIIAPGIILAQAIGRVGCLINGCCYGEETAVSWGIIYIHPTSFCPVGVPVQPTQAYEIIFNLAVFGILVGLSGRLKPNGSLYFLYISLYSLWRLVGDFLRDGSPYLFGLHQAQIIAIIVLAIAIPWLVLRTRWAKPTQSDILE